MDASQQLTDEERWARGETARGLRAALEGRGVVGVATTFVDTSGVARVKTVPLQRLESLASWGVGSSTSFDVFLADDSLTAGHYAGGPVGDLRLLPDLSRLVVLEAQPGWAWAPADRYRQDGTPHPLDSRLLLRRAVDGLTARGLTAKAAVEIEWAVGRPTADGSFEPACAGPAYGMARLVELSDYARDVVTALVAEGVELEQFHPEYAAGQLEVSVGAEDPLGAADTCVLVTETIRGVSERHGLRASFSPKVEADGVGNGGHVHLSLSRDGVNLMAGGDGRFGLTPDADAFGAGVLARLPALLALGAPTPASYLRLVPSHWAGAFACWGLENREAALRMVTGSAGSSAWAANLEVKCFDLGANPYLLLAGLLAAGLAGMDEGASLPEPVEVDPESLDAAERARRGVEPLPADLGAATDAFAADAALAAALGPGIIDTVVAVRRAEAARMAGASPEDVAAAYRWVH